MNVIEALTISGHKKIHQQSMDMGKAAADLELELHHKKYFHKLLSRWKQIGSLIIAFPAEPKWLTRAVPPVELGLYRRKMLWQHWEEYNIQKGGPTSLTAHKNKAMVNAIKTKADGTNKLVLRGDVI